MSDSTRVFFWEDVTIPAGRTTHYLANHGGKAWSFTADVKFPLFGSWGHLRPLGEAPRVVNLRELDWRRLWGFLSQQFGSEQQASNLESWWIRSAVDRSGGWDRFMLPGPGCPTLDECAKGATRPCVIQQKVRVREGAAGEYLDWFVQKAKPAAQRAGWQPLTWLRAMHSSFIVTLFAAPDWSRVLDLAGALPDPDAAWEAQVETAAMQAWAGSGYLQRG